MADVQLPTADRAPGGSGFARLSRRVRTLIVAGVLFIVLFALVFTLPVPYVVLSPGPTYNTIGTVASENGQQQIISIKGAKVRKTTGNLNLTTVGVSTESITPFEAFVGWLKHDEVVVPRSSVYPPGESQQETDRKNTQDFVVSQDNATAAAECELGYAPVAVNVYQLVPGGPSSRVLQAGEQIVSVAGKTTRSTTALRSTLEAISPGTRVTLGVTRNGTPRSVAVTLGRSTDGKGGALGIVPNNVCKAPFTVDLALANQIGGPSAGLMFALGIIDKVGPTDLTKGRFIAGTGTIDPFGRVGPIGGIQLKMIAARAKGATVFLAPSGNCEDVKGNVPDGLKVVKVDTLHGAIEDLTKLENGQSVPGC